MMGLEEYAGMTEDQKLTVLLVKVDNLETIIRERPSCPSKQCQEHETRITTLETSQQTKEKTNNNWMGYLSLFVAVMAAIIGIAAYV